MQPSLRSIELIKTSEGTRIHYVNPYETNPYEELTPISNLCEAWKTETKIRDTELAIINSIINSNNS